MAADCVLSEVGTEFLYMIVIMVVFLGLNSVREYVLHTAPQNIAQQNFEKLGGVH